MRKLFTLLVMSVTALAVNAKEFTDNLVVSLAGQYTNTPNTKIIVDEVENSDGLYNITLKDFNFGGLPLGDIELNNVKGDSDSDGNVSFNEAKTSISVDLGLGMPIPADVTLVEGDRSVMMNDDKLYLTMSISAMGGMLDITAEYGVAKYQDDMKVTLNGASTLIEDKVISVSRQNINENKYTLTLSDFTATIDYGMGEPTPVPVGTIELPDLEMTEEDGVNKFNYEGHVTIKPFSDGTQGMAGSSIPLTLSGEMTDSKLNFRINITLGPLNIEVLYGTDYISSGIDNVTVTPNASGVDEIYDLSGRKLNEMQKGINIVRKADGTTVKVLKK